MGKLVAICLAHLVALAAFATAENGGRPLVFYWHNKFLEPNATALTVAKSNISGTFPTLFSTVIVFDDAITSGPDESSQLLGRSQGMYFVADQTVLGLEVVMTFAFLPFEKRNTLVVLGRNEMDFKVREMPIVGGTGVHRYATGYVLARTHSHDSSGRFTVKYKCYISYAKRVKH